MFFFDCKYKAKPKEGRRQTSQMRGKKKSNNAESEV